MIEVIKRDGEIAEFNLNKITEAIMAGARPMITSSIIVWVVFPPLKWGEEDTISLSNLHYILSRKHTGLYVL